MESISLEALDFFRTAAGRRLLEMAAAWEGDYWQLQENLRRQYPAALCRPALTLVALRRQGRAKFSQASRMFFDRIGLEMASGEEIACYRAARLGVVGRVIDLCCGIGGDLIALGRHNQVWGIDTDRTRLLMASMNAEALGLSCQAGFALADARHLTPRADAVFLDPARRSGQRRARRGADYTPPLELMHQLRRQVDTLIVKVSPAVADSELAEADELNFISAGGQCREAVLYFGPVARGGRSAVLLPGPHTLAASPAKPEIEVAAVGAFIHDPDPAVVRAHVVEELALQLQAWKLSPFSAYLSGARAQSNPFARSYEVLAHFPYNRKRLRHYLQAHDMHALEIKKRSVPLDSGTELRRLKIRSGEIPVSLLLERLERGVEVFICQRVHNSAD